MPENRNVDAGGLPIDEDAGHTKIPYIPYTPPDYGRRFYMELVLTMCSHLPDEDWEEVKRRRGSRHRES